MTSPAARWKKWQREGRPTVGSRKPLLDYLVSNARDVTANALLCDARGLPIPERDVAELRATVKDLLALSAEVTSP